MMRVSPLQGPYPDLSPSDPPYSPVATGSESTPSTFPESPSTHNGDPLWSPSSSFLYESPRVTITLGRRVWGLRQPVYGFNAIMQGSIKLSRNCTHVVRVEVSVETALFIHHGRQLIDVYAAPGEGQGDFVRQRTGLSPHQSQSSHICRCPLLSPT